MALGETLASPAAGVQRRTGAEPLIDAVVLDGDRVSVQAAPAFAEAWMAEPFYARYSPDVDLARLDPALLNIPFVLNVAPVAWLSGRRWRVDRLERRFAAALEELRSVVARLHSGESWTGTIEPDELVDVDPAGGEGGEETALLFSGGLDSVYTSQRVGGSQRLITVRGADVPVADRALWDATWAQTVAYAEQTGHGASWVESNLMSCLDEQALTRRSALGPEWWSRVQHGMALLGLTAPITSAADIRRVVIAESHGPSGAVAHGSHPELDPKVAWRDVRVESHGEEAERQDKIAAVAANPRPATLRVCWERLDGGSGSNCCICEKCLSTALGLMVEGVDPASYGFELPARDISRVALRGLLGAELAIKSDIHKRRWRLLKRRAREQRGTPGHPYPGTLAWLSRAPLAAYRRRRAVKGRIARRRHRSPAQPVSGQRVNVLGMQVDPFTEAELVDRMGDSLARGRGAWVITPNLDHLRRFRASEAVRAAYAEADVVVADGMPLVWASRVQGTPLPGRVAGSDLIYSLAAEAARRERSLFLVGGNPGTADAAAASLRERFPGLRIAGTACPRFGFTTDVAAVDSVVEEIRAARPDVVFVGLPLDGQIALSSKLRSALPGAWVAGLGVSFSFVTGDVRRAPTLMQRTGTEWLWRLAQEPRRLVRRYLVEGLPLAATLFAHAATTRLRRRSRG